MKRILILAAWALVFASRWMREGTPYVKATEVETGNRERGTEKNPSPEPRAPQIVTFPNLKCIQGKGTIEE